MTLLATLYSITYELSSSITTLLLPKLQFSLLYWLHFSVCFSCVLFFFLLFFSFIKLHKAYIGSVELCGSMDIGWFSMGPFTLSTPYPTLSTTSLFMNSAFVAKRLFFLRALHYHEPISIWFLLRIQFRSHAIVSLSCFFRNYYHIIVYLNLKIYLYQCRVTFPSGKAFMFLFNVEVICV